MLYPLSYGGLRPSARGRQVQSTTSGIGAKRQSRSWEPHPVSSTMPQGSIALPEPATWLLMLLCTNHLTKDYGRFRALDDLNLEVKPGEVVGLLGPNGSGKTTALRLILGFLRPTLGHATVAGHDCWTDSVAVRRQVAYLPGELRLYENMSGRQLVRFLGRLRAQSAALDLDDLARRFDIDLERPLVSLSSGMKRKVALLAVLAPQARSNRSAIASPFCGAASSSIARPPKRCGRDASSRRACRAANCR